MKINKIITIVGLLIFTSSAIATGGDFGGGGGPKIVKGGLKIFNDNESELTGLSAEYSNDDLSGSVLTIVNGFELSGGITSITIKTKNNEYVLNDLAPEDIDLFITNNIPDEEIISITIK